MNVKLIETRDINKWLVAVGNAISSKKSELSEALSNELVPSLKDKKEEEELSTSISAMSEYLQALVDVDIKQNEYDVAEAEGDVGKTLGSFKALIAAKMTANSKALAVGEDLPFPELLN